nr:DUF4998 domain-containing protein [uncultured Carboxylicivirga sp.]
MKKIIKISQLVVMPLLFLFSTLFFSCEDMEDSYEKYLENRIYSPRVTGLQAQTGYKTVTLDWINPEGNIAEKIIIEYDEQKVMFDEMVNSAVISDLEIKGYEISVFTEDQYGNRSVPATIYVFPNGEE